ncbi:MAG: hypothetical protein ACYTEP_10290, partial [Planctomycetota bacterium]
GSSFEPLTGETLGLDAHRLSPAFNADAAGALILSPMLPSSTVGRTIWMQATETGNTSNIHNETIS